MIIDIHSHILPNVDDGSSSLGHSIEMLQNEADCGVSEIICTPHYHFGMFTTPKHIIEKEFVDLTVEAEKLGIKLHLGSEIALKKPVSKDFLEQNCFTLANSRYVLVEFSYHNFVDVAEIVYEMKHLGYLPIIAHVERYSYVAMKDVEYFIESGAYIQVNAESVASKKNRQYNKLVMKYIKNNLVHFIASDTHHSRTFFLGEAYKMIKKKFGNERAEILFQQNPKKIIENEIL